MASGEMKQALWARRDTDAYAPTMSGLNTQRPSATVPQWGNGAVLSGRWRGAQHDVGVLDAHMDYAVPRHGAAPALKGVLQSASQRCPEHMSTRSCPYEQGARGHVLLRTSTRWRLLVLRRERGGRKPWGPGRAGVGRRNLGSGRLLRVDKTSTVCRPPRGPRSSI